MDNSGELLAELGALSADPLSFVLWAFPWGEPGTELRDSTGPEKWQTAVLAGIRDGLLTPEQAIRQAVASGHGVGKSCLVAWIILWAISTFEDTRGVVTANTETQLKTKTWVELAKWFRNFIAKDLFEMTATRLCARDPQHSETWRIDMVPWSERNVEAFAGLHNQGKRVLVVMDEASSIPDMIFETTEGALTDSDTEIIWLVCGNPTRNTGRFKECWGKFRERWKTYRVDSREVSFSNKDQIKQWLGDYGDDSDFVRVRVKGEFPRTGTMQFISSDVVALARKREAVAGLSDPFVMGVDVARFGNDFSVICFRRGRDARTVPFVRLSKVDTMVLAARVAEEYNRHKPDLIFVDAGGVGGGVVDRLRMLRLPVVEVNFGAKADRALADAAGPVVYANKRAEMWGSLRSWLEGGSIPDLQDLEDELVGPEYTYVLRQGLDAIQLESKDSMRYRGVASPDIADALALTFAYPVQSRDHTNEIKKRPHHISDYDPFNEAFEKGAA